MAYAALAARALCREVAERLRARAEAAVPLGIDAQRAAPFSWRRVLLGMGVKDPVRRIRNQVETMFDAGQPWMLEEFDDPAAVEARLATSLAPAHDALRRGKAAEASAAAALIAAGLTGEDVPPVSRQKVVDEASHGRGGAAVSAIARRKRNASTCVALVDAALVAAFGRDPRQLDSATRNDMVAQLAIIMGDSSHAPSDAVVNKVVAAVLGNSSKF